LLVETPVDRSGVFSLQTDDESTSFGAAVEGVAVFLSDAYNGTTIL